jgi:hypothetical protein
MGHSEAAFDLCFQKRRAALPMPAQKGLRLDDKECLFPGSNRSCQKDQEDAIYFGTHRSFALSTKDDQLLA